MRPRFAFAAYLIVLLVLPAPALASGPTSYSLGKNGEHLPAPLGYVFERTISTLATPAGAMKNPSYVFLDGQGHVWVADTDNNRLIELQRDGTFLREVGKGVLAAPQGLFVTSGGDVWVADSGHTRIVHLDPRGNLVKAFGKPDAYVLASDASYKPTRVVVDRRGYLYVINSGGDYRGIIELDEQGDFRGFFGANHTNFDLSRALVRQFATREQKQQVLAAFPASDSGMFLDSNGFLWTVAATAQSGQIKKLNAVGNNVLRVQQKSLLFGFIQNEQTAFFGEKTGTGRNAQLPQFVDVAVDRSGIFSAIDASSGKVYQYDESGNMLTVFGGKGAEDGLFDYPSSLKVDADGRIYVLDSSRGVIQVFRPTQFAELVQRASTLYYDGRYEEAASLWKQVLQLDTNYLLAHDGLGKAYQQRGFYQQAMDEFQAADDRRGYSGAFAQYRQVFLREHFDEVIVVIAVGIASLLLAPRVGRFLVRGTKEAAQWR